MNSSQRYEAKLISNSLLKKLNTIGFNAMIVNDSEVDQVADLISNLFSSTNNSGFLLWAVAEKLEIMGLSFGQDQTISP